MEQDVIVNQVPEAGLDQAQDEDLSDLFAACRARAYWIALDILRDPEEAADVVQDAILRLERSRPRFRGECSLSTYLYRIVLNLSFKTLRRRLVRLRLRHLLPGGAGRDPHPTPEHLASCAEQTRRLLASLEELPPRQRAAFLLRHSHGLPVAEVAAVLQISEGTVKTHLVRAMERLRRALREDR
jgi:RNA polymerase sigma-70 factor (ECF subfamily)